VEGNREDKPHLNVFSDRCLQDIVRVLWKDHMTNSKLLQRAGIGNLQHTLAVRRKRVIGHDMYTEPPDIKTSRLGNKLDSGGPK